MIDLTFTFRASSLHFSTRARLRSIGQLGVVPTVDGWTLRGCGVLLEARGYPQSTRLGALARGVVVGALAACVYGAGVIVSVSAVSVGMWG
jgi:hypothetical protein